MRTRTLDAESRATNATTTVRLTGSNRSPSRFQADQGVVASVRVGPPVFAKLQYNIYAKTIAFYRHEALETEHKLTRN